MDLYFIIALVVFLGLAVLFCSLRGFKRSVVRLIGVAGSAVIALFITKPICQAVLKAVGFAGLERLGLPPVALKAIARNDTLAEIAENLPKMVFSPVVFPIVFGVLCLLANIPVAIVNRKKPKAGKGKGALIGLAIGVLSFLLVFGPIMGALSMATETVNQLPEKLMADLIPDEDIDLGIGTINPTKLLKESGFTNAAGTVAKPILDVLTTAKAGDSSVSLSAEISNLIPLVEMVGTLEDDEGGWNIESLGEQIPVLLESAEKSEVVREVVDTSLEAFAANLVSENPNLLDDDEAMEAVADLINTVNGEKPEDIVEMVKENIDLEKFPFPVETIDFAKELVNRKYGGTDWTPEKVQETLTMLVQKYAE